MNETSTVRPSGKLAHALDEEARQTGLVKGEIARQASESPLRSRNLGVMKGHFGAMQGPSDLSTNKIYRPSWNKKRA